MEQEIIDEMDTAEKLEPDNNTETQDDVNETQKNETAEVEENVGDSKEAATEDTKEKKSSRGRHPCISCARTFSNKRDLMTHQYMHRENPVFLCSVCNKNFTTEASYRRHVQSHKPATNATRRQYMCSQCSAVFDTMKQLSAHHSDKHVDEKRFVCGICGSQFAWPENLRAHHRTHEVNPHECSMCGRRFVDATSLRVHTRNAHGPNSEPATPRKVFTCALCGRAYQFDFSLRAHMKGHEQSPITGHHFQTATRPAALSYETSQTLTGTANGQTSDAQYVEIDRDGIIDINAAVVGRDNQTGEIIVEVFNFNSDKVEAKQTPVADIKAAVMSTPVAAVRKATKRSSVAAAAVTPSRPAATIAVSHGSELELTCTTDDADVGTEETEDNVAGEADLNASADNTESVTDVAGDDVKHADSCKTKVEGSTNNELTDDKVRYDGTLNADGVTSSQFVWYAPPQDASTGEVEPAVQKDHQVEQTVQPREMSDEMSATSVGFGNSVQNDSTDEQKMPNPELEMHVVSAEQHDIDSAEQSEQKQEQTEEQELAGSDVDDNDSAENEISQCDGDEVVQEASELLGRFYRTPEPQPQQVMSTRSTTWSAPVDVKTVKTAETYKSVEPAYSNVVPRTRARRHIPRSREPFMFNCIMTNEKPFCCQLCGETFRWEISLNIHHKVHLDGKIPNQKRRKARHIPPTPANRGTAVRGGAAAGGGITTRSRGGTKRQATGAVKSPPPVGPSRIVPRCASSDDEESNDGDTFSFLVTPEDQAVQEAASTPGAKSYRKFVLASTTGKCETDVPGTTVKQTVRAGLLKKCNTTQSQGAVNGSNSTRGSGSGRKLAAKGIERGMTAASNISPQLVYVTVETIGAEDAVPSGSSAITIGQEVIDLDDLVSGTIATTQPPVVSVSLPAAASCAIPASVDLLQPSSVASQPQVQLHSSTHADAAQMRWCKHSASCRRAAFVCHKCQRVVTTLAAVRLHSRRHSLADTCRETLACASCPACFTSRADLLLHRRVCHTSSHHPCRRCQRVFSSVNKLRRHLRRVHQLPVATSICQQCDKRFFASSQCSLHQMSHKISAAY